MFYGSDPVFAFATYSKAGRPQTLKTGGEPNLHGWPSSECRQGRAAGDETNRGDA
jgi:hypothetical protein